MRPDIALHYDRHPLLIEGREIIAKVYSDTALGRYAACYHRPGTLVVDIGCGGAAKNIAFAEHYLPGARVVATDISANSIAAATERGRPAAFMLADTACLPLEDGSADLVIATGTLHHMPDPEAGLREVLRVTRRGGFAYVSVYNRRNVYFVLYNTIGAAMRFCGRRGFTLPSRLLMLPWRWLYAVMNALMLRQTRQINDSEAESFFHDYFLSPIAHFYTREGFLRLLGPDVEVIAHETHALGMMHGFLIRRP